MTKYLFLKKIVLILLSLFLVVSGLIYYFSNSSKPVQAGSEHNLSGWAWSENIGWISFNNTSGGGTVNYGVHIDPSTGNFSGYAWSENIGWISFNEADLEGCPDPPCQAWLDFSTNKVYGWAKVLNRGDGWIRLRDTNYGVWLDTTVTPSEFRGWAWSDMVIGWISFNCKNQGVCATSNYKVIISLITNQPPSATNLNVSQPNYCLSGPAGIFSWTFTDPDAGDRQSAYQVQVDNNLDFSSPEDDSGKVESTSPSYATPLGKLSYNTTYYWRLKVWDSKGTESTWISGPFFRTPTHAYPRIEFTWSPLKPHVNQPVQFTDQSTVYGGTTKASWDWTFQDANPPNSTHQHPQQVTFSSAGPKRVTLKVDDSDGFSCTGEKTVNVQLPLPEWQEIPPLFWLKKLLANLGEFFKNSVLAWKKI